MTTVDLMQDQVKAIFRALTGKELEERGEPEAGRTPSVDEVARRFAALDLEARQLPGVAERIPPFSFTPPIDVIEDGEEWVIELAVPGVDADDVDVEIEEGLLVVRGVRDGGKTANGRVFLHGEIPRGPFKRVLAVPGDVEGEPRVDGELGLVRVRLSKKEREKEKERSPKKERSRS